MQLEAVLEKIREAGKFEIDFLLDEVMRRKRELYPEWEIFYYAFSKDETERLQKLIDRVMAYNSDGNNV